MLSCRLRHQVVGIGSKNVIELKNFVFGTVFSEPFRRDSALSQKTGPKCPTPTKSDPTMSEAFVDMGGLLRLEALRGSSEGARRRQFVRAEKTSPFFTTQSTKQPSLATRTTIIAYKPQSQNITQVWNRDKMHCYK